MHQLGRRQGKTTGFILKPFGSLEILDEESPNCWDSLFQLQACTGEIVLFFLDGEARLGHSCCQALSTVGEHCWPNMIGNARVYY
ncbi:hypothetical protein OIU77_027829 [Salix suchowensis]|uniref:Prolamin-like domain-containing protein n=1 Tax=Salix suchowensis TaxID=1278906 RepID=A0ABQ9BUY8_9ROSI|nr:hypothetical protein OIU77_027829 [Salix suchowensis]